MTMTEVLERMLADIRKLAPEVRARGLEIEAARRMPLDLVTALKSIGIFRMFVPRSHGGLELDLPAAMQVIRALAHIDGSLGWTAMIGSVSPMFMTLLPREAYDEAYRSGPDVMVCGSMQPGGTAEAAPGGWRVSGRWPFASGCQHAQWMAGFCVMTEGGKPLPGPSGAGGPPMLRFAVLKAAEWEIEDTWHAAGLKGTGSHHIVLENKFVPASNIVAFIEGTPCMPGPLFPALRHLLPLVHGAFGVGMAEGALDELMALANTGRQQQRAPKPMRESEMFQGELGRIAADVRAAAAFHRTQVESHWSRALAGTLTDDASYLEGTQAAIWIATTATRVADACFTLGGGAALYESSPLQRRLRDMHVAAQHAVAHQRHYPDIGKMLLDHAIEAPGLAA
jgi:alkylation response protein AidB-like acyl-CoA dehydrogenase